MPIAKKPKGKQMEGMKQKLDEIAVRKRKHTKTY